MRLFDIRHGAGVVIQPRFAEERVPSEADKKMNHGEDPDGEMMDSMVHLSGRVFNRCEFHSKRILMSRELEGAGAS
jgi:hypothetical protein